MSVVGVNIHRMTDEDDTLLREIATSKIETWHSHVTEIERFKRNRNTSLTCEALGDVAASVADSRNVIAPVIAALEASATMGEIATTMRCAAGMQTDIFNHPLPLRESGSRNVA